MKRIAPTPGPLKAEQGWEDEPDRWVVVADYGEKAWHVATIENGAPGDTMATEGATARLFAAAHELLAACKRIRDALPAVGHRSHPCESALRDVIAAIEKAETFA